MALDSWQLGVLFIGQMVFGAFLVAVVAVALKGRILDLFDQRRGRLLLQIITIFFVCTILGNLALMKILDAQAISAMFGAVLGYVFGSVTAKTAESTRPSDEQSHEPADSPVDPDNPNG